MPQKRKSSTHDFPPSSSSYSNPKRPRPSPSTFSSQFKFNLDDDDYSSSPLRGVQQPRLDPTYGQRGAFPGLDDDDDDDDDDDSRGNEGNGNGLFYGPASDGFEYLRMVRFEAKGVPKLLVAKSDDPSPSVRIDGSMSRDWENNNNDIDDNDNDGNRDTEGGYYADGAYVGIHHTDLRQRTGIGRTGGGEAVIDEKNNPNHLDINPDPDPQEKYYISLLRRFTALSTLLQSSPPPLPPHTSNNTSSSSGDIYSIRKWRWVLLHRQPNMVLLSQLPHESVVNGLAALESMLQRGELRKKSGKGLGVWAWGLLAKCRHVGEMGSEDVGVLRGLGKTAWWVMREIRGGVDDEEGDERDKGEEGEGEEGEGHEKGDGEEGVEGENNGEEEELEEGELDEEEEGLEEVMKERKVQLETAGGQNSDKNDHHPDDETPQNLLPPNLTSPTAPENPSITIIDDKTITITSSSAEYSGQLPTPPPNNHQHHPSSSYHPPPDSPSDNPPPDIILAAAQKRLLEKLSPDLSSAKSDEEEEKQKEQQQQQQQQQRQTYEEKDTAGWENDENPRSQEEKMEPEPEPEPESEKRFRMTATLDMILTVVGERYGQRDLLVGRGFWGEGGGEGW